MSTCQSQGLPLALTRLLVAAALLASSPLSTGRRHPKTHRVPVLRELNVSTPAAVLLSQIAEGVKGNNTWDAAWCHLHNEYARVVQASEEAGNRWEFLFYGDSTVEALNGTFRGTRWSHFEEGPKYWKDYFNCFNAASFGLAGDGVKQLAYRLLDGEFPQKHPPHVVALAVGSTDLHPPTCTKEASKAVKEGWKRIINYIREQAPSTKILALAILPKGEDWPNFCTSAILDVNAYLKTLADTLDNVHFLNLERHFLQEKQLLPKKQSEANMEIIDHFMPDSLNIGNRGIARLCVEVHQVVKKLLNSSHIWNVQSPDCTQSVVS